MADKIEWYDPAEDPAVLPLAASITQRARWALPDVMLDHDRLPPEIARVTSLFQERIRHLTHTATQAVGSKVEFVVAGVEIVRTDALHVPSAGPADVERSRVSRIRAERLALSRRILEVAEQVRTASDAHQRQIDALRKAAAGAAHHLNVILHDQHRFASEFTFPLPDTLHVDDAVYEIGFARISEVLNTMPADTETTDEEGDVA